MEENAIIQRSAEKLELLARQADAQFALSPVGQTLKQFEVSQRMGQMFAQSTIVPDVYKGNLANCAVAVDMALRMNMPPMMVMQNLYIVHGNPAWSSKFLIACVNACGRFTPLEFKMKDNVGQDADEYGCRCVAYAKTDTKRESPLYGPWVTWKQVKAEGWLGKNGSKWKTMPDLMFRYRAAAQWQRLYAPEIAMGFLTQEEAAEIQDVDFVDVPAAATTAGTYAPEPQAPVVDPERLAAARDALTMSVSSANVRAIKKDYADIYDADPDFRESLIAAMSDFQRREEVSRPPLTRNNNPA